MTGSLQPDHPASRPPPAAPQRADTRANYCFSRDIPALPKLAQSLHIRSVATPNHQTNQPCEATIMKWDTPEYSDIRFGFEVTMYINNK